MPGCASREGGGGRRCGRIYRIGKSSMEPARDPKQAETHAKFLTDGPKYVIVTPCRSASALVAERGPCITHHFLQRATRRGSDGSSHRANRKTAERSQEQLSARSQAGAESHTCPTPVVPPQAFYHPTEHRSGLTLRISRRNQRELRSQPRPVLVAAGSIDNVQLRFCPSGGTRHGTPHHPCSAPPAAILKIRTDGVGESGRVPWNRLRAWRLPMVQSQPRP